MAYLIPTKAVLRQQKIEAEQYNFVKCDYCALIFHSEMDRKVHAMNHFRQKHCVDCDKMLIEICGDWYELHVPSNCNKQNNSFNCIYNDENKEEFTDADIKQELDQATERLDHFPNEPLNTSPVILNFDAVGDLRNILEFSPEQTYIKPDIGGTERSNEMASGQEFQTDDGQLVSEHDTDSDALIKLKRKKKLKKSAVKSKQKRFYGHIHRPKKNVTCDICGKIFCNFYVLRKHMTDIHCSHVMKSITPQKQQKREICKSRHIHRPKSNITCDICKKVLKSMSIILRHMKALHSPKPPRVSCEICKKTYASNVHLEFHMYSHTKDYPHICSYCGKGYVRLKHMLIHERVHTGIKPYSCRECEKSFNTDRNLKSHMRKHSNERPFKCDINDCNWSFKHAGVLKRHKARAHGITKNRNPCPICAKEFPESTYHLNRHLQQAHKKYGN